MSSQAIEIADVPRGERDRLHPILEDSFAGLYLWHARRTLQRIDVVKAARVEGEDAGLVMLKVLSEGAGYVYYVAVQPRFRRRGVGGRLLDEGLSFFSSKAIKEVYASIEEDNEESKALFASRGFAKVHGSEMNEKYGRIRTLLMYREMTIAPGEEILVKRL